MNTTTAAQQTMNASEAQAFLGIPHATFYRLVSRGELPKPCAWEGRTPLYSRPELEAAKAIRNKSRNIEGVEAKLAKLSQLAELAVALGKQMLAHADSIGKLVKESEEAAVWWESPANDEQIELQLAPVTTLAGTVSKVVDRLIGGSRE